MTVTVKTGRKDGIVSSYNLFWENGLRLKTDDLIFLTGAERAAIREQFQAVIVVLLNGGATVVGSLDDGPPVEPAGRDWTPTDDEPTTRRQK